MGKELVSFYTQPHTGNLFIFPVEYRISDLYSFPITCILSHQDQLIARLCYYGYEQRNAIVKGDLLWFEKVSKELDKLLDQALQANTQSLARFDEVMLFFDPKKCSVLNTALLESIHNKVFNKYTSLILIFRDWLKRTCVQNKQYEALAKYRSINDVLNSFIELTKTKNFNMTKQFAGSKNKLTSLQYTLDDSIRELKIANCVNSLVDQHKLKNTQLDKTSINLNRLELITDFKNRLMQFQSYCEPVLAILNRQIMSSPKYKKELKFNVMQILSEANTSSVIHLITNNLVKFFTESNFITNDKLLNGFNNTVRQGTTVTNEFEALERGINQVIIQQTFETYVRELLDAQKVQGVIILNRNLKQLIFNKLVGLTKNFKESEACKLVGLTKHCKESEACKLVGLTKHYKESEAYKPWAGLSEFDSNESSILHDILYLESISILALTMNSVVFSSEHAWKDSFNRFKYYGFRNKFKVFKSYTKNLQTSKVKKPSEVLSEIIFMLPLKLRDAVIEDIDNGVIVETISRNAVIEDIDNGVIVETISRNTVIFMPDILLFKNNKQTILDQLKTLVCQVIKQGDRLTVTLEAVLEDKKAYKFYIVLKSSTGDKLYFDFGYDLINAEATEKIMSIFNDVVKTRKEYTELICTVMQEFETLEKELELLVTEFETYVRELLDIQQLNKIITFDNTLKNLAFNKMIGMEKQNKDFETREPWNGLSELVPNETDIIHDIIYLNSLSKLGDIVTKLPGGYKNSRVSTKSFKYYTYRKQYKVFKSYFKHLQTTKKGKSSEKLCKVLLTSLLKFRDTFIHDMDYGLLRTEKIPNDLIISLKSILTESSEKQSVKDMLKVNFEDKLKNGENISVSLEGIADTKNSYTFYITLQSEVGTKLYFDFGYDQITAERAYTLMAVYNDIVYQITAEKAHTHMAVYNDIVCASKGYTELYNSVMLQFETLEKELLLLRTEHTDKLKFSDITGNLYLQDKLKNAIISIQQLADKLKLTNIDLTSDVLEKLKESLLVYKFVLNELYHRWYFLPADGPYDEMILPQDYPYADKPVNGINEHPFPQGADKATREIPVDINILTNVIDFCFNLWEANIFLYGGFTPQQAIKHFVNLVYEWLAKYVPTKIDKIPEYYPEDYEIYDNPDTEREDYWRLYRWIRWYAEAIVMNVPKEDEIKLKGNTYIKKLLEDLIKYFEDHHGVYGTPGTKVIDKIKGLRHKWLDKYNNLI